MGFMYDATFQISGLMIGDKSYDIEPCCGQQPKVITEDMTGDWDGIRCTICDRVVYSLDDESITDWNNGVDDNA